MAQLAARVPPRATLQRECINCGKCKACKGSRRLVHGPYWYVYWFADGKTRSAYVGSDARLGEFMRHRAGAGDSMHEPARPRIDPDDDQDLDDGDELAARRRVVDLDAALLAFRNDQVRGAAPAYTPAVAQLSAAGLVRRILMGRKPRWVLTTKGHVRFDAVRRRGGRRARPAGRGYSGRP